MHKARVLSASIARWSGFPSRAELIAHEPWLHASTAGAATAKPKPIDHVLPRRGAALWERTRAAVADVIPAEALRALDQYQVCVRA
jgi:hypothetical protein